MSFPELFYLANRATIFNFGKISTQPHVSTQFVFSVCVKYYEIDAIIKLYF